MWSDVDTIFTITLEKSHLIRILNVGGIFKDQFKVFVDGTQILSRPIWAGSIGSHTFTLDGYHLKICWRMNWLLGQLTSIVIMQDNKILAQYGDTGAIDSHLTSMHQKTSRQTQDTNSSMQRLLKAAKEQGGQLSIAQAAIFTELKPEEVKKLLQETERMGYSEIINDPETGAIRYKFDV